MNWNEIINNYSYDKMIVYKNRLEKEDEKMSFFNINKSIIERLLYEDGQINYCAVTVLFVCLQMKLPIKYILKYETILSTHILERGSKVIGTKMSNLITALIRLNFKVYRIGDLEQHHFTKNELLVIKYNEHVSVYENNSCPQIKKDIITYGNIDLLLVVEDLSKGSTLSIVKSQTDTLVYKHLDKIFYGYF